MNLTNRLRTIPPDKLFFDEYNQILSHSLRTTLTSLLLSKAFFVSVNDQIRNEYGNVGYDIINKICRRNGVENHIIVNAAFYHDLGKLDSEIFETIIQKRKLTKQEKQIVEKHPIKSLELFKEVVILKEELEYDGEEISFPEGNYFGFESETSFLNKVKKSFHVEDFIGGFIHKNREYLKMNKATEKSFMFGDQQQTDYLQIEDIILHHHERNDGSGYPNKLRDDGIGSTISMGTQIISVSDIYCALTEHRAHQKRMNHNEAIELMKSLKNINQGLVEILNVYADPVNWIKNKEVSPYKKIELEGWPKCFNTNIILGHLFPYINNKNKEKINKLMAFVYSY